MLEKLKPLFVLILALFVLFGMFSCAKWEFNECKKVGHSTLYCVVKHGK